MYETLTVEYSKTASEKLEKEVQILRLLEICRAWYTGSYAEHGNSILRSSAEHGKGILSFTGVLRMGVKMCQTSLLGLHVLFSNNSVGSPAKTPYLVSPTFLMYLAGSLCGSH